MKSVVSLLHTWTATTQPSQVTAHLPAGHPINYVSHKGLG